MFIAIIILFSGIIVSETKETISIKNVIEKLETLEKLEKRVSESISEGKFFEHSKLSLKWYDKFIYFYWNTTCNRLYFRWDGLNLDVKNIFECGFNNRCLYTSSYNFNMKYMFTRDYVDFIVNVKKLIEERIDFLNQNIFSN